MLVLAGLDSNICCFGFEHSAVIVLLGWAKEIPVHLVLDDLGPAILGGWLLISFILVRVDLSFLAERRRDEINYFLSLSSLAAVSLEIGVFCTPSRLREVWSISFSLVELSLSRPHLTRSRHPWRLTVLIFVLSCNLPVVLGRTKCVPHGHHWNVCRFFYSIISNFHCACQFPLLLFRFVRVCRREGILCVKYRIDHWWRSYLVDFSENSIQVQQISYWARI